MNAERGARSGEKSGLTTGKGGRRNDCGVDLPVPGSELRVPRSAVPVALTIAGSDSGGGAGIQADLKTFAAFGVFGTSAVTCVTAQNPDAVTGVEAVSANMVVQQIEAVCDGFPVAAAKSGMLYSSDIIRAVSGAVAERSISNLVVDPVMVATSGARLLQEDAIESLIDDLLPMAAVITPNLYEAEILCGRSITSIEELEAAAVEIGSRFGSACVVKGGHLLNAECGTRNAPRVGGSAKREASMSVDSALGEVVDVLFEGGRTTVFSSARVDKAETHGTGCTFSAAMAALLARGEPLGAATKHAKQFVVEALKNAIKAGKHRPLGILQGLARPTSMRRSGENRAAGS